MRAALATFLLLGGMLAVGLGQERVDLAAPVLKTSTASYTVSYLALDWAHGRIVIELDANNGDKLQKVYDSTTTPTGQSLMIGLNKANLSTRSLNQRIFDRLILDGVVSGSVAGAPQ